MKIKLKIPPDGSFVSTSIYEGLLKILANGASLSKNIEEIEIITSPDIVKNAFRQISEQVEERLAIENTGINDVDYVEALLKHFGVEYVEVAPPIPPNKRKKKEGKKRKKAKYNKKGEEVKLKMSYGKIIKYIASSDIGWNNLGDVDLCLQIDIRNKIILIGTEHEEYSLYLPVFQPDRYKGLRLPEAGIGTDMFSFRIGLEATLIGLLGMGSAHIASIGKKHFFLFIDPSQAAEVIASRIVGKDPAKYAKALLDARDAGIRALKGLGDAMVYVEAAVSRLVIDLGVRKAMRSGNISRLSLRLVRVDEEGNTYKIYGDIPLTISSGEVEYAEALAKHLDPGWSPLIDCLKKEVSHNIKNKKEKVQPCVESTHVINAVLWLMRYVSTGSKYFLAQYVRELMNAADIADAEEKSRWRAARYRSMMSSLLRVM